MSKILYYIIYPLLYLASLLPIQFLHAVLRFSLYIVGWRVFSYRKSVILQNFTRSFPEAKYREVDRMANGFSKHLCRIVTEWIDSFSLSKKSLLSRVSVEGEQHLNKDLERDHFLIMGHFGNWELINVIPLLTGRPVYAIYKEQVSEVSNLLSEKMRSRFGVHLLERNSSSRFILSNKVPSVYIIIADQSPGRRCKRALTFMHQPTLVYEGIERLASRKGADISYVEILPTDRVGNYHISFTPLDREQDIVTQFYKHLEASITRHPHYWLWSHRRWKCEVPTEFL